MALVLKLLLSLWVLPLFAIAFAGLMGGAIKIYQQGRWSSGDGRIIAILLGLFVLSSSLWIWIWS